MATDGMVSILLGDRHPLFQEAVRSVLDDIAGVGPARKRALLRKFGSVRAMQEVSVDEIAAVGGVGTALAERIKLALTS